jgi:hypothetical protein
LKQRKIYILLTLAIYLVGLVYVGLNFHFHLSHDSKQITEHNCINHKFHPGLNSEFACVLTSLNLNHLSSKIYTLDFTAETENISTAEILPFPKPLNYLSILKRAPPAL